MTVNPNAAPVITEEQINTYRNRELHRFVCGEYTRLPDPWRGSYWFSYGVVDYAGYEARLNELIKETEARGGNRWDVVMREPYPDHFAHISTEDGGCIAFTENHIKGVADRQTRMKPGRYLKKYYGEWLSDEQIRDLATAFLAECAPAVLKFAVTADEIEHVYRHGPSSCMAYAPSDYYGHVHPVRVYGESDLQVAYFDRGEDNIKARVVCWPATKVYGRVYGDEARLVPLLRAAGYAPGSLEGARIRAIQDEGEQGWIMPYVDSPACADLSGEWFILRRRGEYSCQSTNGVIEAEDERTCCEHCGDRIDDDEAYSIDGQDGLYCASCESDLTVECARTGYRIVRDDAVQMANGDFWSQRSFERRGFTCPIMHENYPDDEGVEMSDGETWSQVAFDGSGFTCQGNGGNYDRAEMVILADGALWSQSHFDDYGHVNDAGENVRNADAPVDRLGYRCAQTLEMPLVAPIAPVVTVTDTVPERDYVTLECVCVATSGFTLGKQYQGWSGGFYGWNIVADDDGDDRYRSPEEFRAIVSAPAQYAIDASAPQLAA